MLKHFPCYLEPDFVSPPIEFSFIRVDRLKDGVRISSLEKKVRDFKELLKYKARDFQLNEIIEAGAYDLLQPVPTLQMSRLSSLDFASKASLDLENYQSLLDASVKDTVSIENND